MLDNLYENIGGKIKNWAKWIFIFEAICSIITGIVILSMEIDIFGPDTFILCGILLIVFGPIVAWVSSWVLYGFGKLIEDVEAIRNKKPPVIKVETEPTKQSVPKNNQDVAKKEKTTSLKTPKISPNNASDSIKNESKPKEAPPNMLPCPQCGEDLAFMGWDDNDLTETQICPMCGKEILFKR